MLEGTGILGLAVWATPAGNSIRSLRARKKPQRWGQPPGLWVLVKAESLSRVISQAGQGTSSSLLPSPSLTSALPTGVPEGR